MRITFLGTADSSGYPHPFCDCANCTEARRLGGPSIRLRSSALINDDLLIDLGPDLAAAASRQRLSLRSVRWCLQTHAHVDHLEAEHLYMRSAIFHLVDPLPFTFYGSRATIDRVRQTLAESKATRHREYGELMAVMDTTLVEIAPGEQLPVGPYRVTAIPATHDAPGAALLFAVSDGVSTIFYGNDTGALGDDAWETIGRWKLRFDCVILDHTQGINAASANHMNGEQVRETLARMREAGLLQANARCFANHICHLGNPVHPKLAAIAQAGGYEVAFDGLTITVPDRSES